MTFDVIMWFAFFLIWIAPVAIDNTETGNKVARFSTLFLGAWFYCTRILPSLYR